jgi:DNA polymerase-3 subunit gamma/tau
LNSMLRTFDDLGYRQEQRFHLELGLLKLVHMQRLLPLEDLFRQLSLPSGAASNSGNTAPRISGTSTAPKQIDSSLPRTNASPAPGISASASPVREEFKHPSPPLNETTSPVTAENHPLQGMFGGSTAAPAGVVSRLAPAVAVPKPEPSARVPSKSEKVPDPQPESKPVTPASAATSAAVPASAKAGLASAAAPETSGERSAAAASQAESPKTVFAPDIETMRAAMSRALTDGGHETAGYMLESGTCEWNGTELRVRVAASKTLFDMMYPATAQQLVKEAFRQTAGPGRTVRLEPGDPSPANGKKSQPKVNLGPPADGETHPQDHPLIRHAQQLFSAEVRSVVSLRDPQASKS